MFVDAAAFASMWVGEENDMAKAKKNTALNVTRGVLFLLVNLIVLVFVIIVAVKVCQSSYKFFYQVFGDVVVSEPPGENVSFQIEKGVSEWDVAGRLEEESLIVSRYTFYLRLKLTIKDNQSLKVGRYTLNTSMTYEDIIEKIVKKSGKQ